MPNPFKDTDREISFRVCQMRIEDPDGNKVVAVKTRNSRYPLFDPSAGTRDHTYLAPIVFEPGQDGGVHLRGYIFNKPAVTNFTLSVTSPLATFEMENGETIAVTRVDTSTGKTMAIGRKPSPGG